MISLGFNVHSFLSAPRVTLVKAFTISVTQFIHLSNGGKDLRPLVSVRLMWDNIWKMPNRVTDRGKSWVKIWCWCSMYNYNHNYASPELKTKIGQSSGHPVRDVCVFQNKLSVHYLRFGRGSSWPGLFVYTANKHMTAVTRVSFQVFPPLPLNVPITADSSSSPHMHWHGFVLLSGIFSLPFVHFTSPLECQLPWPVV